MRCAPVANTLSLTVRTLGVGIATLALVLLSRLLITLGLLRLLLHLLRLLLARLLAAGLLVASLPALLSDRADYVLVRVGDLRVRACALHVIALVSCHIRLLASNVDGFMIVLRRRPAIGIGAVW